MGSKSEHIDTNNAGSNETISSCIPLSAGFELQKKRFGAWFENNMLRFFWRHIDQGVGLADAALPRPFVNPDDPEYEGNAAPDDLEMLHSDPRVLRIEKYEQILNPIGNSQPIQSIKLLAFSDQHATGPDRNRQQTVAGYWPLRAAERLFMGKPPVVKLEKLFKLYPAPGEQDDLADFLLGLIDSEKTGRSEYFLQSYLTRFAEYPKVRSQFRDIALELLNQSDGLYSNRWVLTEFAKYRKTIFDERLDQYSGKRFIDRWSMTNFKEWWFRIGQWQLKTKVFEESFREITTSPAFTEGGFNAIFDLGDTASDTGTERDHVDALKKYLEVVSNSGGDMFYARIMGNHDFDPREPDIINELMKLYGHQIFSQEISANAQSPENERVLLVTLNTFIISDGAWDEVFRSAVAKLPGEEALKAHRVVAMIKAMQDAVIQKMSSYAGQVVVLAHNPRRFIRFATNKHSNFNLFETGITHIIGGHVHSAHNDIIGINRDGLPLRSITTSSFAAIRPGGMMLPESLVLEIDPSLDRPDRIKVSALKPPEKVVDIKSFV